VESARRSIGHCYIGTAGWSVPKRYADDFPPDGSHLERYAQRLNAVEINSSFYRPHRRTTYERWAASVPDGFRFAVKVPKAITHEHRLADCDDLIARFLSESGGLGPKLAVLLVQLPPKLAYDGAVAGNVFAHLRQSCDASVVCEPRHPSWFTPEVEDALSDLEIARVAADPEPVPGASNPGGWSGLTYYRMHGSPRIYYSDYESDALIDLDRRLTDRSALGPVWCIFDNTAAFAALGNALTLRGCDRVVTIHPFSL
jgi:uncharacterized protein YecE (DUF72 family)